MKIACTVTNDLSQDQRLLRICTTLAHAGHEVTLIGRELPNSLPLRPRPYRQHRIRCRYHEGKRFYAEYNWRLTAFLNSENFDVVNCNDLDTILAAWCTPNVKRVFDAHEWFSEVPEVVDRPPIRALWRALGRRLVPRMDARYTVGRAIGDAMEEDYGTSFEVVSNFPYRRPAVDAGRREPGVLLYQGVLNPGRGLDWIIQDLPQAPPHYRLWIAGAGPERPRLEALTDRLNLRDRVTFLGFVPPDDLPALTRRAWLGLNVLDAGSRNHTLSLMNKSLDYIQDELPSVQMDFPEYRRINDRFGCYLLLDRFTPGTLQRLHYSLTNYDALVEGCRRAKTELCWERESLRLLEIYDSL